MKKIDIDAGELLFTYLKYCNYSATARALGLPKEIVTRRMHILREDSRYDIPANVRHTAESKRQIGATNKARHGADFYARIGAEGGVSGHDGGFASTKVSKDGLTGKQRARIVGAIGGRKSRRPKAHERPTP